MSLGLSSKTLSLLLSTRAVRVQNEVDDATFTTASNGTGDEANNGHHHDNKFNTDDLVENFMVLAASYKNERERNNEAKKQIESNLALVYQRQMTYQEHRAMKSELLRLIDTTSKREIEFRNKFFPPKGIGNIRDCIECLAKMVTMDDDSTEVSLLLTEMKKHLQGSEEGSLSFINDPICCHIGVQVLLGRLETFENNVVVQRLSLECLKRLLLTGGCSGESNDGDGDVDIKNQSHHTSTSIIPPTTLIENGGVDLIINALLKYEDDATVQEHGLGTIANLFGYIRHNNVKLVDQVADLFILQDVEEEEEIEEAISNIENTPKVTNRRKKKNASSSSATSKKATTTKPTSSIERISCVDTLVLKAMRKFDTNFGVLYSACLLLMNLSCNQKYALDDTYIKHLRILLNVANTISRNSDNSKMYSESKALHRIINTFTQNLLLGL